MIKYKVCLVRERVIEVEAPSWDLLNKEIEKIKVKDEKVAWAQGGLMSKNTFHAR